MKKIAYFTSLLILCAFSAYSQTPGLIFKTAGSNTSVLDPNGDGYISISTVGFQTNDQTESEIPYKALVVPSVEPTADSGPGPDCGFTDIVDSGLEDPVFTYLDANSNLLFRFRLGSAANNSKGYSVLIDTDQKFGFTGSQADPNAISGNPGFEIEIVLRTNFGVSLYDVNGTTTPVLKITQSYDNYAQKSIALTTNCGDADYFYDFFIPFSTITSYFPSISTTTPLRMVAVTSMNPFAAIGNNAVSDVGGIDDQANGYNLDNIFQSVIDNFTATPITGISSGTAIDRSATPTLTSPIANSATTILGTSTEIGATIKVYMGATEPYTHIGTATVSSEGTWLAIVSAVSTGHVIRATATNTSESESSYSSIVTVTNCSSPVAPYNLVRETNRKYISGNGTPGAIIKVYLFTSGSYVLQSGSFTLDAAGPGSFCWVPGLNTNTCDQPSGAGSLQNGTTYYMTQTVNGCESAKASICVDNQTSVTPTLTQTVLYSNTATLSGTSGSGAAITIYADGVNIATTTASGTAWTVTINLSGHVGKYISVGAVDGTKCMAISLAASVIVQAALVASATPAITGSYCGTNTGSSATITGTSVEANGAIITTYINGTSAGVATVYNSSWSRVLTVKGGDVITATATGTGKIVSAISSGATVSLSGTAPTVTLGGPIIEGSTTLSGTFVGSGTLKIYVDGMLLGSTTSNSFTLAGLSVFDLYAGAIIKATLSVGGCESAMSAGTTVGCLLPSMSIPVSASASSVCSGSTVDITLSASESGVIYQLYKGATAIGSSKLGTGNDLVFNTEAVLADATFSVTASKISPVSCTSTLATSVAVSITQLITGNTISAPPIAAFCQSANPNTIEGALPSGGNSSFTYQWQSSTDNIIFTNVADANNKDYDPGQLTQTTYFQRIVYSGPCQTVTDSPVVISIIYTSLTNTITSSIPTLLNDGGIPQIDGSDAGNGISYVWQYSLDNNTFTNTAITSEGYLPIAPITVPTFFRRIASNGVCSSISDTVNYTINHSPSVSDFSKSVLEDTQLHFSGSDFIQAFTDMDGNTLVQIRIETLPANGSLIIDQTILTSGSIISLTDLEALIFTPENNFNGLTSFSWKGYDDQIYSNSTATVSISVGSINDAPAFTKGLNQTHAATDGDISVAAWATNIASGPADEISQTLTFQVTNDAPEMFSLQPGIDALTGNLTYTIALSASGIAHLNVQLVDNGGTANGGVNSSTVESIMITITTGTNAPPVVANGVVALDENAVDETIVHTVKATDSDSNNLLFSITSGNKAGAFTIDASTGTITVSNTALLDFEQLTQFVLVVNVTDGIIETEADIVINLNNLNDNSPVVADATVSVDENSANGSTVYTVSTTDADGNTLSYSISDGNEAGVFTIDSSTGVITVADSNLLNFEQLTQFVLTVMVSDGTNEVEANITINLNNLNDDSPVVADATVFVDENSLNETEAYTMAVTDADGSILSYAIASGNEKNGFIINSSTGVIRINDSSQLDFEEINQFVLVVLVSDGVNEVETSITIHLNNVNDNAPVVGPVATASVDENSSLGAVVFTVPAVDPDGDPLSYSIVRGNELHAFAINPLTGVLTVADPSILDYELAPQYVLTVLVSDGWNTSTITITVTLTDINEMAQVNPAASSITAAQGTIVADGISTTVITVQFKDINGNNWLREVNSVTLSTTTGMLSSIVYQGNGSYQAILTSSTMVGTALITGTLNETILTDTELVEFTAVPIVLSATLTSSVVEIPADGFSTTTLIISIKDQNNNPVSGAVISISTTSGTLSDVIDHGDGTYTIVLTSSTESGTAAVNLIINGLSQSLTIEIIFSELPGSTVFIPQGFSPDGDGVNDTFRIEGANDLTISLKVFNRWGSVVYEASNYKNDWDGQANQGVVLGQKLPDGTYFYVVDLHNQTKPSVRYFTIKRK